MKHMYIGHIGIEQASQPVRVTLSRHLWLLNWWATCKSHKCTSSFEDRALLFSWKLYRFGIPVGNNSFVKRRERYHQWWWSAKKYPRNRNFVWLDRLVVQRQDSVVLKIRFLCLYYQVQEPKNARNFPSNLRVKTYE